MNTGNELIISLNTGAMFAGFLVILSGILLIIDNKARYRKVTK